MNRVRASTTGIICVRDGRRTLPSAHIYVLRLTVVSFNQGVVGQVGRRIELIGDVALDLHESEVVT